MTAFPRLFTPLDVGPLRLRNRVVMSAMATGFATVEGGVTPELIAYYEARARGGVGMVVVEGTMPMGELRYGRYSTSLHADDLLPGWATLARAIKGHGAAACVQLLHPGRQMLPESQGPLVGPSPIPLRVTGLVPRELDVAEIGEIVEAHAHAAARARAAGFDAVELHGAHGYLIAQFLSPLSNQRRDAYGGDLAGRSRFLLELIAAIRREAGADFPILCRLSVEEFLPGGITLDESLRLVPLLEDAGVAAIRVSGGNDDQPRPLMIPPLTLPRGEFWHLSAAVNRVARVPTDVVGRIDSPELAERLLAEGVADFVSIGRALIADPEWARKAETAQGDRIRPCIYSNEGCIDRLLAPDHARIGCVMNPAVGREASEREAPASRPGRVVVVGGGPAGLQAATTAARRGHVVWLLERDRLGGRMALAARAPGMGELGRAIDYLERELDRLGVRVQIGRAATVEEILALSPAAVIVATGARALAPPGLGLAGPWLSAEEVLRGEAVPGSRAVVIGGRLAGLMAAELLAEGGRAVTVVDPAKKLGLGLSPVTMRWFARQRLQAKGVTLLAETPVLAVGPGYVRVAIKGMPEDLPTDSVVVEMEYEGDDTLARAVEAKGIRTFRVGDCRSPRTFLDAFHEGDEAGRAV